MMIAQGLVESDDHEREQWMNVQPMIKNSILSLQNQGKITEKQLSSLSDSFDRLHVDVIDKELRATMTRLQREYVRQDQLQTYLDALNEDKADIGKVQTLEQKVDRLAIQLTSISSQIQEHTTKLKGVESSVFQLQKTMEDKLEQSSLDLNSYIDERVSKIQSFIEANVHGLERQLKEETEENKKINTAMDSLSDKVQNMGSSMKKFATAEEVKTLNFNKASNEDLNQIREQLLTRVTHAELNHELNQQTKPLCTTLTALEKAVQIQDYTSMEVKNMIEAISNSNGSGNGNNDGDPAESYSEKEMKRVLLDERLFKVVDEALNNRALEDEIDVNVDKRMIKLKSFVVHEMNDMVDAMRVETASIHREQLIAVQKHADIKIASHIKYVEENREMIMKIRESIQELAKGISSALARKADVQELDKTREDLVLKMKEDALENVAEFNTTMNTLTDVEERRKERSHITSEKYKGILVATEKMKIQLTEATGRYEEEINALKKSFMEYKTRQREGSAKHGCDVNSNDNVNDSNNWRTAVGKLTADVKSGMEERPDREELYNAIRRYMKIEKEKSSDSESTIQRLDRLESDVRQVEKEHKTINLRLFWSSGNTDKVAGQMVSWDVLGFNTHPTYIKWKRNKPSVIHIKASGLYRVVLAVFTGEEVTIDIQLNGNSILVKKSRDGPSSASSSHVSRPKHAAGDVTCVCLEEYISLPSESDLSARITSSSTNSANSTAMQAFIDIRKA